MSLDYRLGYLIEKLQHKIEINEELNIDSAATEMKEAIKNDKLIYIFGAGGHTCLVMQEMFWRSGGLANICPMIDYSIHPVTPAYMYLGHERLEGVGTNIVDYYGIEKNDIVIIFHSYGINTSSIDCAIESKRRGAKVIGISSSFWRKLTPKELNCRHSSKKHLFDFSDICIDNYVPYGDAVIEIENFDKPITGIASFADFYIAHRLEIECVKKCVQENIKPPVWSSVNTLGGDQKNNELRKKYNSRIKSL